jgi:hypothetical protein
VAKQAALEEAAKLAAAAAEPAETTTEEAYAREQKERCVTCIAASIFTSLSFCSRQKRYVDHDDRGKEKSKKDKHQHRDGSSSKEHKKRSKDESEDASDGSDGDEQAAAEPDVFQWGTRKLRCDAEEVWTESVTATYIGILCRIESIVKFYAVSITVTMHVNNWTNAVIRAWAMHSRGRARGGEWRSIRCQPK